VAWRFFRALRFLDFLQDDIQVALLLYKHGILINVPAPWRFAFHNLVVSQRRRSDDHENKSSEIWRKRSNCFQPWWTAGRVIIFWLIRPPKK